MTPAPASRSSLLVAGALGALAAALPAGCVNGPRDPASPLRKQNARLEAEVNALAERLAEKEKQIRTLQALGETRLDRLFHVYRIDLGRYTGGVNLDDRPGDDGVRIYLQPKDRDGHPLKAAGSIAVRLFDLDADARNNLLGTYEFPVEKIAGFWQSGFLTYNYKFDCRWKGAPPKHAEVTVRVEFTDYLTGRTFTAQRAVKVALPAPGKP